jgi:hypothetical protein
MLLAELSTTELTNLIVAITGLVSAVAALIGVIKNRSNTERLAASTLHLARNQNSSPAIKNVKPEVMDTIRKIANGHGKEPE